MISLFGSVFQYVVFAVMAIHCTVFMFDKEENIIIMQYVVHVNDIVKISVVSIAKLIKISIILDL